MLNFDFFNDDEKSFKNVFQNLFKKLKIDLPIRWDGNDFLKTIKKEMERYIFSVELLLNDGELRDVRNISNLIVDSIEFYLNGSPSLAYTKISALIDDYLEKFTMIDNPDIEYYRIARVNKNCSYGRERIFHPPFSLRNMISTNRYSIAGYPCLYLSSNLNLCFKEIDYNPYEDYYIVSKFKINKNIIDRIEILDLSVKPQDFIDNGSKLTNDSEIGKITYNFKNYLYAFPLIMACSFIRTDKNAPFAPEYIVPQLLLERLKNQFKNKTNSIIGIKYFSCSSVANSKIGYNVVFPTYKKKEYKNYCEVLNNIFDLTKPVIVNDYPSIEDCKKDIDSITEYRAVMNRSK